MYVHIFFFKSSVHSLNFNTIALSHLQEPFVKFPFKAATVALFNV